MFDGFTHQPTAETAPDAKDGVSAVTNFMNFISQFGNPQFILSLSATDKYLKSRWSKKNDDADFPEEGDAVDEFNRQTEEDTTTKATVTSKYTGKNARVELMNLDTSNSLDTTKKQLKRLFQPKVIVVNHEKRLGVDVTCANLAIKYNLLYISVYQLIRSHIEGNTEWGKKLTATKRFKEISLTTQVRDEFNEAEFSGVHFN